MRIKIPNPVTIAGELGTAEWWEQEWLAVASPGTEVKVTLPTKGPETIESVYDVAMSTPWFLEEIRIAEEEGFDAVIIPCMADPGLYAAREVSSIPVVGLAETSFLVATALGHKFTIMALIEQVRALQRVLLRQYGMEHFHASTRVLNIDVKALWSDKKSAVVAILEEGRQAVEEDGADVIVMSCGGMSGIAKDIEKMLGVPIIDPNATAMRFAEMLVSLDLSHSKRAYMTPPQKRIEI